ncbi:MULTISPECIES: exodeoxyribonuclease VII large subunit [Clostridium]|uniref:exodeoxyribonuclease VII large subunit n=1 Tax=Clostridium TaxID=1485 RepID=UPI0008255316|nr:MULTISPECIES: exodeoxyribonuclease VII large subunit [Clostridium]
MEERVKNVAVDDCYSPQSIINIYNNSLNVMVERKQLILQGMYKVAAKSKLYNKSYYDRISDENTGYEICLVVNESLRGKLKDGFVYKFKGYLNRRVTKDGHIQINYYVIKVLSQEGKLITEKQYKAFNIQEQKDNIGYKEMDKYIKDKLYIEEKVRIAVIIGNNSIINEDIKKCMGESKEIYDISPVRINLSDKNEIISKLEELDKEEYNVICISRGGGSGLEIFDDPDIAEAIIKMKTRFISAIGHVEDKPFVQKIADKKCDTPSSLGIYLRDINKEVVEKKTKEIENENKANEDRERYKYEISELNIKNDKLQNKIYDMQTKHSIDIENLRNEVEIKYKKQMYIYIIAALIIGFMISRIIK